MMKNDLSKDLIFEELSISDEVNKVGDDIAKQAIQLISQQDYYEYFTHNVIRRKCEINLPEALWGMILRIQVEAYFFQNREDIFKYANDFDLGGTFYKDDMTINLKCYGLENEINEEYLRAVLYHELKYVFQLSLFDSKELPSILVKATNLINDPTFSNTSVFSRMNQLLYMFSKMEIDANMEALYQELRTVNPSDVKTFYSQTLSNYSYALGLYEACLNHENDEILNKHLYNVYKKNYSQLMNIIKVGIDYYKTKKRKVFMKYCKEQREIVKESTNFKRFIFVR